ncbi:EndoS/ChiA family endoglycosidase [Mucilaginibacter sp. KACC 22063]|uniref:EndoS/ChiA family endoglycosidase n=1 Tax=Mucilaginibacter sp. KACC 22063 TaxID=3025666 RepID=UPI0023662817|nr:glycosyl hydrolase family 18 protein [Mucilaginibacter sp. KACC 22063]WDF55828.1 glycosyl hydrolase family 18 protein [Mucilaginibacter sp. KACC 22063]
MKKLNHFKSLFALTLLLSVLGCKKETATTMDNVRKIGLGVSQNMSLAATALPAAGQNKVAYYVFDVTPVNQGILPLTTFTDKANVVIVFEGTLWELADTVHYNSGAMQNAYYKNKRQILADIQTLRARGIKVLMNVDDNASWSTATPFTTYNGTAYNYTQFASFVNDCVNTVGLDGISLDVEHNATDNTNYRNLIKEFGKYFGPLSTNSTSKMYTGAFYSGGAPGPIFRETALSQYLNFVMDQGYFQDNTTRFNYWANTLGNAKVMLGMVSDYNSQSSAVAEGQRHPNPDKAGIMVYAGNKNKGYTDAILASVEINTTPPPTGSDITNYAGSLTAQYQTGSPSGEDYTQIIDNNTATKYYTGNASAWVQFKPNIAATVVSYTITSANDVPARDPKNWTLQGSNNGTSWTTLDTQTNQSFASRFLKKTYAISNTTSYAYYRLSISAPQSGSVIQFSEWELIRN